MARGSSGRIVLEVDPELKDELYAALAKENLTLKNWFLSKCNEYLSLSNQPSLFQESAAESSPIYRGNKDA